MVLASTTALFSSVIAHVKLLIISNLINSCPTVCKHADDRKSFIHDSYVDYSYVLIETGPTDKLDDFALGKKIYGYLFLISANPIFKSIQNLYSYHAFRMLLFYLINIGPNCTNKILIRNVTSNKHQNESSNYI